MLNKIVIIFCLLFLLISNQLVLAENSKVSEEENLFDEYFMIALTELYFGANNLSGNMEAITDLDEFKDKVDKGRISFYLKGKIKGKYLLTAWFDTEEKELEDLFDDLGERKVKTPFEKLDPNKYYPVYGDNSQINSDINTAGNIYLCLESEEFKALWGNYQLAYNENQIIGFNRLLYGFNLDYKLTKAIENKTETQLDFNSFWHQPFSLHSRDEMKVTGGMLYYLRNDDLIIGTENLKLELRDAVTGRVLKTTQLIAEKDYDLNYLQGRIILKKHLNLKQNDSLIQANEGDDKYYLIAEYDYSYDYQKDDKNSYGLESTYYFSDKTNLSATYIKEEKAKAAYEISGLNFDFENKKNMSLKIDWARSKNIGASAYTSDDGGLRYREINLNNSQDRASAWNLDLDYLFRDNPANKLNLYYDFAEAGFSSGAKIAAEEEKGYGIALENKNKNISRMISYDHKEKAAEINRITTVNLAKKYTEQFYLEGEIKHHELENTKDKNKEYSLLSALGFEYQLDENKSIYASQQLTLDKSDQQEKNNLTRLGGRLKHGKWNFKAEGETGSEDSLLFGAAYQINKNSEIYTTIEEKFSDEKAGIETIFGTKSKLTEKIEIYGEHQLNDNNKEKSAANVLGLEYSPDDYWTFALDYSKSELEEKNKNNIDRNIIGFAANYKNEDIQYGNRIEYRKDKGNQDLKQILMTGDLSWQYSPEFTFLSEIEYSKEQEKEESRYLEATLGLAYRPIKIDSLNLIMKYSLLEEKNNQSWSKKEDYQAEKSQVFALEAIYDLSNKWQLGEKIAYKNGEVKLTTDDTNWFSSETYLWVNRLNYQLRDDIDIFTEYRILENKLAEDSRSGFLLGGYKRFSNNLKLGIGYNFTDFNDDLTDLSYEAEGWFVNLIKVW